MAKTEKEKDQDKWELHQAGSTIGTRRMVANE
jgi:hypothetical protein